MRGTDDRSGSLFSYVDLEQRVPPTHSLRVIKAIVDDVLRALDGEFAKLYESTGRQSIAPERLLRASLLQAFYSVRSERQQMEAAARLRAYLDFRLSLPEESGRSSHGHVLAWKGARRVSSARV